VIDREEEAVVTDVHRISDAHGAAEVRGQGTGDVRVLADGEERSPVARAGEEKIPHEERALADGDPDGSPEGGAQAIEAELRKELSGSLRDAREWLVDGGLGPGEPQ
jgi:hypothetical protein